VKVVGDAIDVHVALFGIQMSNRNQGGVFDADKADTRGVPAAYGFVPREKTEQTMHQSPEMAVGPVHQDFRSRNRQRRFFATLAGRVSRHFLPDICFLDRHG
jgi:hypothetical protein